MLNLIAALYGCSTVINKFVEDDVPDTPNSLTSLIRFLSAGKHVLRYNFCTNVEPKNQCGMCLRGPTACGSALERSSMMSLMLSLATLWSRSICDQIYGYDGDGKKKCLVLLLRLTEKTF